MNAPLRGIIENLKNIEMQKVNSFLTNITISSVDGGTFTSYL
jgi:hypothetical protein